MSEYQATYGRPSSESRGWQRDGGDGIGLAEVVNQVRPTILIGASDTASAFTENIVRRWRRGLLGHRLHAIQTADTFRGEPGQPNHVD